MIRRSGEKSYRLWSHPKGVSLDCPLRCCPESRFGKMQVRLTGNLFSSRLSGQQQPALGFFLCKDSAVILCNNCHLCVAAGAGGLYNQLESGRGGFPLKT